MKLALFILLAALPAFGAVQYLSENPANDVAIKGVRLEVPVNTIDANGDPVGHSGFLSTPKTVVFSTNRISLAATNRLILGAFTNYYGGHYDASGNNIPMFPGVIGSFLVSTNAGATWLPDQSVFTNCLVAITESGAPGDAAWFSNVVVYSFSPAAYGNTLDFFGQNLFCDFPTSPRSVANRAYADGASGASWAKYPAAVQPSLNGLGVVIDSNWTVKRDITVTNGNALAFYSGGQNGFQLLSAAGGSSVVYSLAVQLTATNLLFVTDVAGTTSAPAILTIADLTAPNWTTQTAITNWTDGAKYFVSVPLPTNNAFYRARQTFTGQTNVSAKLAGPMSATAYSIGATAGGTTNISIGGTTLYFTNGLFIRASTP